MRTVLLSKKEKKKRHLIQWTDEQSTFSLLFELDIEFSMPKKSLNFCKLKK